MLDHFYLQLILTCLCARSEPRPNRHHGLCNFEALTRLGIAEPAPDQAPQMFAVRQPNVAFILTIHLQLEAHGTGRLSVRRGLVLHSKTDSR